MDIAFVVMKMPVCSNWDHSLLGKQYSHIDSDSVKSLKSK